MKTNKINPNNQNILGANDRSIDKNTWAEMIKLWRRKVGYFSMFAAFPTLVASHVQGLDKGDTTHPLIPAAAEPAAQGVGDRNRKYTRSESLGRQAGYFLPHQKAKFDIVSAFTGGDNCPGTTIPSGTYTSAAPFTDSGDTTGANNTVSNLIYYYYSNYNLRGPDLVYTFTLTSRGAAPEILVTPSSTTYNPSIYILDSRWSEGCPSQNGAIVYNWWILRNGAGPGGAESVNSEFMRYLPLNVPLHLFIDSDENTGSNSGAYTLRMKDVTIAPGSGTRFDVDGDHRADLAVFRPSDGVWYLSPSNRSGSAIPFGRSTDKIAPADFDGDRKSDLAIFRDGVWWRINSTDNTVSAVQFGSPGDIPVPADYTGDGRADLAIYRNGDWWVLDLSNGAVNSLQFGLPGDKPVVADYDGDGKADQAIYRNGQWHIYRSRLGYTVLTFGLAGDIPIVGDYDGDGLADPAVYRGGIWYLLRSQDGYTAFQYGVASDIPVPADYDGDGRTDAGVFRNGEWYLCPSNGALAVRRFGLAGDQPLPAAYLP